MINLKTLTITISSLIVSTAFASSFSSIKTDSDEIKILHENNKTKIKNSLSNYYQDTDTDLNLRNSFQQEDSETDYMPISLPNNCTPISPIQERCDQKFQKATKAISLSGSIMDSMSLAFEIEDRTIIRAIPNHTLAAVTPPVVVVTPPVVTTDPLIDVTNIYGSAARSYQTGAHGAFYALADGTYANYSKVHDSFNVFGCADGANAPMKFYNSNNDLIATIHPSTVSAKLRGTSPLTSITTMGYNGKIPNYFDVNIGVVDPIPAIVNGVHTITGYTPVIATRAGFRIKWALSLTPTAIRNPINDVDWDELCSR
jgi:hypothetical protein